MSHGKQLALQARKTPDKAAFRFEGSQLTFAQLDERVTRLANALRDRGVQQGDRVAVLMTNRREVVESYLAGCRLGAIVVPVNFRLVSDEVVYIVEDSGAKALSCLVSGGDVEAAEGRRPGVRPGVHHVHLRYHRAAEGRRPLPLQPGHEHLQHDGDYDHRWGGRGVAVRAPSVPHRRTQRHPPLREMVGGTSVILPSGQFDANEVVDALEREQVTGCYFAPTQWQQIRAVPGIADRRARSSMPRLVSASRDVDVIAHCAPGAINR